MYMWFGLHLICICIQSTHEHTRICNECPYIQCVCVYIHIHMCVYMYIHTYMHTYIQTYIHCIHAYMHIRRHDCNMHEYTRTHMSAHYTVKNCCSNGSTLAWHIHTIRCTCIHALCARCVIHAFQYHESATWTLAVLPDFSSTVDMKHGPRPSQMILAWVLGPAPSRFLGRFLYRSHEVMWRLHP